MQKFIFKFVIVWLTVCFHKMAFAHEFWLEPHAYRINSSDGIVIDLRNGENFDGTHFPYVPERFSRFTLTDSATTRDVISNLGAIPAMTENSIVSGLNIVGYESTLNIASYENFDQFSDFVTTEGAEWAIDVHRSQGLAKNNFKEIYTRHAKSLICVDNNAGSDRLLGMEFEWLALTNPYEVKLGEPLILQLWHQNRPSANLQVSVFSTADGVVEKSILKTDNNGIIRLYPNHSSRYLISAVKVKQPSVMLAEQSGAIWQSLWAAMTFEVSDQLSQYGNNTMCNDPLLHQL